MKNFFLALAVFITFHGYGQTYDLEMAALEKKMRSTEISRPDGAEIKRAFDNLFKEGLYPKLPYDTAAREIVFEYVLECPGTPKTMIYKRLKEWCILHYEDFGSALRYEDMESGKMVLRTSTPVYFTPGKIPFRQTKDELTYTECYHAVVFIVKDNKFKLCIRPFGYGVMTGGYRESEVWLPAALEQRDLSSIFPIVHLKEARRKEMLELLRNTVAKFEDVRAGVWQYVKAWEKEAGF